VRGYVVDIYFCVFDVSVEEFGAGLGFWLGFRIGIGFRLTQATKTVTTTDNSASPPIA
jgi:hypothetical protein